MAPFTESRATTRPARLWAPTGQPSSFTIHHSQLDSGHSSTTGNLQRLQVCHRQGTGGPLVDHRQSTHVIGRLQEGHLQATDRRQVGHSQGTGMAQAIGQQGTHVSQVGHLKATGDKCSPPAGHRCITDRQSTRSSSTSML